MHPATDVIEAVVEPQADHSAQEVRKAKDENMASMRDIIKASKDLIERQNQQIEEMRQAQAASRSPPPEPEEDFFNGLDEEDALEVKKAREIFPKAVDKAVKKALDDKERKQRELQQKQYDLINSAKQRYDDFDEVMAQDNVDTIITKVPAMHHVVSSAQDPIEAAYHLIKNSAAYDRKKTSKVANMVEKAKLEDNLKKPKSPNSIAQNQSSASTVNSEAGTFQRLTKQQQKELWTEHNKKLGRRG
jgi:hypothetical protein